MMDHSESINLWKKFISKLEDDADTINEEETLSQLDQLFKHLTPQAAVRHQIEIENCTIKTNELIPQLFKHIHCSDRPIYSKFLSVLLSYGYFRIAQITYHNAPQLMDPIHAVDSIYLPILTKVKWYNLEPLLPDNDELSWKGVLNSGLVMEEKLLLDVCFKLLTLKLHFYCIIMNLQQFQGQKELCIKNGRKVACKLLEIIRDVAFNEEIYFIGIDTQLFNLMQPFFHETQSSSFIEAIVENLFKPCNSQTHNDLLHANEITNIHQMIKECMLDKTQHQEMLVTNLIQHLKCNLIRRKRRHSMESEENGNISIESLLASLNNNEIDPKSLIASTEHVEISSKILQSNYLKNWINIVSITCKHALLTPTCASKLLAACSILLISISDVTYPDLINELSELTARVLDSTSRAKYDKLFNIYDQSFLIEFTKLIDQKTNLLSEFNSPVQQLYRSYFNKYFLNTILKNSDLDKLSQFVEFICDGSLKKNSSRLLQFVCIRELANHVEMFHNRLGKKNISTSCQWAKICGRKLYKFIKHRSHFRSVSNGAIDSQSDDHDMSLEQSFIEDQEVSHQVAIHSLVSLLRISIQLNDKEVLDIYSDILLRLFNNMTERVKRIAAIVKSGTHEPCQPLDNHLARLLLLYIKHKNAVKDYLNYELVDVLSTSLLIDSETQIVTDNEQQIDPSTLKKTLYNQIKSNLEKIYENASKNNSNAYQTIINQQYNLASDEAIGSIGDINREKPCGYHCSKQTSILADLSTIIINNCSLDMQSQFMGKIVESIETLNPLDHPLVLYSFLILRSFSSKHSPRSGKSLETFKQLLPRISCGLIRISKSVELGPSIHAFKNPGSHLSNRSAQCCTYSNCIDIYTQLFDTYPPKITNHLITDALQMVVSSNLSVYAKLKSHLAKYFLQLAFSISRLLKSLCLGTKDDNVIKSSMAIFLSVLSHTIRCLIIASDETRTSQTIRVNGCNQEDEGEEGGEECLKKINNQFEADLELLAIDIARTLNNLSFLRVRLIEYAPHLISSYIKDTQKCACPENIKSRLDEGVFRIFNLVDAHQRERQNEIVQKGVQRKTIAGKATGSLFEMIHARLDQASREIFRDLHTNYSKFHRYLGKC